MIQCIPGTLARQLVVYRQRVAAAPVLLECETLSRDNITRVLQEVKARGRERVGQRPDRVEPRAVKRRPKPHPLLTIPRDQARKNVRRGQQCRSQFSRTPPHRSRRKRSATT